MSLAGVRKETRQPITQKHTQSKPTCNTSTPEAPILFIRIHGQRLLEMANHPKDRSSIHRSQSLVSDQYRKTVSKQMDGVGKACFKSCSNFHQRCGGFKKLLGWWIFYLEPKISFSLEQKTIESFLNVACKTSLVFSCFHPVEALVSRSLQVPMFLFAALLTSHSVLLSPRFTILLAKSFPLNSKHIASSSPIRSCLCEHGVITKMFTASESKGSQIWHHPEQPTSNTIEQRQQTSPFGARRVYKNSCTVSYINNDFNL